MARLVDALRLPSSRPVFLGLAAVVAVGVAAGWVLFSENTAPTPGPVDVDAVDSLSFPMTAGKAASWGHTLLLNSGEETAVIDRIAPVNPSPGLEVLDVKVAGPDRTTGGVSFSLEWPTRDYGELQPVAGAVLPPQDTAAGRMGTEVIVALRARKPGRYDITGVELEYRVGDTRHRRVLRAAMRACVHDVGKPELEDCEPPAL